MKKYCATAWGLLLSHSVVSKSSIMSLSTANIKQRPIWPCNEFTDFLVRWERCTLVVFSLLFSEEGRWRIVEIKVLVPLIYSLLFLNARNIKVGPGLFPALHRLSWILDVTLDRRTSPKEPWKTSINFVACIRIYRCVGVFVYINSWMCCYCSLDLNWILSLVCQVFIEDCDYCKAGIQSLRPLSAPICPYCPPFLLPMNKFRSLVDLLPGVLLSKCPKGLDTSNKALLLSYVWIPKL